MSDTIKAEELVQTWLLVTTLGTFEFKLTREAAHAKWAESKQSGDFTLPDGGKIRMDAVKAFVIGQINQVAPVNAAAMAALQRGNGAVPRIARG